MNAPTNANLLVTEGNALGVCPICDQPEPCACCAVEDERPTPAIVPRRGLKRTKSDAAWATINYSQFYCKSVKKAESVRKRVTLDENGDLENLDVIGYPGGTAVRRRKTLDDFGREISAAAPPSPLHAFYVAGVSPDCKIDKALQMGGERGRSKEGHPFPDQDALLTVDSDSLASWPILETIEDVVDVLAQLGLDVNCVAATSGSSGLKWPKGERGLRGLHTFYSIDKGAEIPRVLETLHVRAWLAGYGRILVCKNGVLLPRSIVDPTLKTPNQPIFEFGAILLDKRITQKREVRGFRSLSGVLQVKADSIAPLTDEERAEFARRVDEAKAKLKPEADRVAAIWADEVTKHLPESERAAERERRLAQREKQHRDLMPHSIVRLNDGSEVTVAEILADRDKWHGKAIRDPDEPEYGTSKATIVTKNQRDGRAKILSRAHGIDVTYYLEPRPMRARSGGLDLLELFGGDVVEKDGRLFDKEGKQVELETFPNPAIGERPCFYVLDDVAVIPAGEPCEFNPEPKPTYKRAGLYLFGYKAGRDGDIPFEKWVCGPIHVEAQTRDKADNNFGRLLRFKTSAGTWREWPMPMAGVRGDAAEVVGSLLSMGLITDGSREGKQKLIEYLASSMPQRMVRCVPQIGWTGDTFVLPDCNIGPAADDTVLQSEYINGLMEMHTTGGTFEGWQGGVAAVAQSNPLLVLALSVAFAGPVLGRTHGESGGIHFTGPSSIGKTTILKAACSVWGGKQSVRTWLATANGLEGTAAMSNDCLLALDEISQCEPHHVGAVIYMIGNEAGKQRADRSGAARTPTRHRCAVISTGERSIADAMLEGGKRAKAGQGVRLIDVDVSARYGVFDALHGFATSKDLAESVKVEAEKHHGHAGRRFLEALTGDDQDLVERLTEIRAREAFNPPDADSQASRVAARFALFALAGELATEYDVTGWTPGTATTAAEGAFQAWHAPRGKGSAEGQQTLRAILAFIEKHGSSRFQDAAPGREVTGPMVRDRAGWFRYVQVGEEKASEREYLFSNTGLREALTGLDFNGSTRLLAEFGVLPTRDGKHSVGVKIEGTTVRVYPILQRKVETALDGVVDAVEVRVIDPFDD